MLATRQDAANLARLINDAFLVERSSKCDRTDAAEIAA